MLYDVKTPEEYINMLDNDWKKEKLQELRAILKLNAPEFTEGINYKMLSYNDNEGPVLHLNVQKNYVSLYVGDTQKIDVENTLLKGLEVGKGCVRFKKSVSISETRIDEFIAETYRLWKQGKNLNC